MICMIHFWMILSMLVKHPKSDDLYDPLLDDSEHAHYPKLDDLYDPLLNDNASSNNTIFNNVQQLQCDVVAMKLTRNCTRFRLMAVGKLHMVTQHSLRAYSRYTVSMECAMGLRCCRPASHPNIRSKSLKRDSLVLPFLFMIIPAASMCTV